RDVYETTAHEIAHQWFGNLVTMQTWDDIWLNESFASLMETRLSQRLVPELDTLSDYFLRTAGTLAAFEGDGLDSTHPVRAHVERPDEISQIFDEISYGKGCAVLAMLEAYIGPDRFRRGVSAYLDRFRYGNARTEDLWEALGAAGGEAISPMATPWIDRPGHPIVHAVLDGTILRLRQRRYSLLPRPDEEAPWPIPLVLEVDGTRR
ncbi:protein containing Peptidase M1, membrane alanine aminopeptidase, partial [mine drainage metagenome]